MNIDALADKLAKDWSFMERGEFFTDIRAALAQVRDETLGGWTADDCITWLYAKGYHEAGSLLRDDVRHYAAPPWEKDRAMKVTT